MHCSCTLFLRINIKIRPVHHLKLFRWFSFFTHSKQNLNQNIWNNTKMLTDERLLYCECDTEILLLVCWYISGWEYMIPKKNPSSNICLISAGRSRTTEGWAGLMLWHNARHLLQCPSPGSLFRCDRWHKQRILQGLCPPKICVFISQKSKRNPSWKMTRWLPCNRLRSTGILKAVVCAYGNLQVFLARMRAKDFISAFYFNSCAAFWYGNGWGYCSAHSQGFVSRSR